MTLVFDPLARRLTTEDGVPVSVITIKRSDVMPVKISVPGASAAAKLGMYAKLVGDYSSIPLVAVEAIGNPVELTPQSNTQRINTALGIGTDKELERLEMMCELVYSEDSKQIATVTLLLVLHNNIARPGLPGDQLQDDPYSADIPIATPTRLGKVMPDNTSITITPQGKISATAQSTPIATTSVAGKVRPDGTTIRITEWGGISTESVRSIGGYDNCDFLLGAGLTASVVGSELVRLDVVSSPSPGGAVVVASTHTTTTSQTSVVLGAFPAAGWYRLMIHCKNVVTQSLSGLSDFALTGFDHNAYGSLTFTQTPGASSPGSRVTKMLALGAGLYPEYVSFIATDESLWSVSGDTNHYDIMLPVTAAGSGKNATFSIPGNFADVEINCIKIC